MMMVRMMVIAGMLPAIALAQGSRPRTGSGTEAPPTALGGHCAVSLVKMDKLVKGERAYSSVYDGQKYLFPSAEAKKMFDENPTVYAPAMGGDCVVCKVEMKREVPGKPEFRVVHKDRLYLFPSEEQVNMFKENPEKYADADVALNGYCAVCKVDMGQDIKGKPEFALDYKGTRYLFPGKEQLEKFRQNPRKYAQK